MRSEAKRNSACSWRHPPFHPGWPLEVVTGDPTECEHQRRPPEDSTAAGVGSSQAPWEASQPVPSTQGPQFKDTQNERLQRGLLSWPQGIHAPSLKQDCSGVNLAAAEFVMRGIKLLGLLLAHFNICECCHLGKTTAYRPLQGKGLIPCNWLWDFTPYFIGWLWEWWWSSLPTLNSIYNKVIGITTKNSNYSQ